ncbi:MAG: F0F1 ATP synthase subunit A [Clostridium sp.]
MGDFALQISNINFTLFGHEFSISWATQVQWGIMIVVAALVLVLTRRLETVPKGKQVLVEKLIDTIYGVVENTMGKSYRSFAPYIGTIMIFILFMNLTPLFGGIKAPTYDFGVTLALAIMTFVLIQATAIKKTGFGHYLKAFGSPKAFLLPLNIVERVFVPVSLSLRLFGNITAAVIIMELIYHGLEYISGALLGGIPLLAAVIPIPFHMYFDIFDGTLQMIIFSMLTMIFIKTTTEH